MARAIDSHVHLYPPEIGRDPAAGAAASGEEGWAAMCVRRRRDGRAVQSFPNLDGLLKAMDAADIERSVLLGWYWRRPENCALQNRFYATCIRRHPDRLSAFAAVPPAAGPEAALAEVRRARDDGLCGLGELSPHAQGGGGIGEAGLRAALGFAADEGLPVNVHATDPEGRPYPGRVETPLEDFLRLAGDFPAATFILAHWGGMLPVRLAGRPLPGNLLFDTAASPLLYDDRVWPTFIAAAGAERVLFGSDYPLNLYPRLDAEADPRRFLAEARSSLPPSAREKVLRNNLLCLLSP